MFFLQAESLSKRYGEKLLFQDVSLSLYQGEKKALVARNGAGKTSLLNVLAGVDGTDSGIVRINKDISVGYLQQEPALDPEHTILQAILQSDNPLLNAVREYEEALITGVNLQPAMDQMSHLHAWDYEARVQEVLTRLKLTELQQKTGTLSGGQRKRVALARLLISQPDLYILDEPTNHLDVDMIEWLEEFLSGRNVTLLLITHDRYFLDRITDEILELSNGTLYRYKGNYSYFLEQKAERQEQTAVGAEKARQLLKKELEWARRMPKARTTKAKYRLDAIEGLQEKAQGEQEEAAINLQVRSQRLGSKIIELKHIAKSFGDKMVMRDFSYNFRKGERIGIVGDNGTGKTTFLNVLTGLMPPDSGEVETGETIRIGYYRQEGMKLKADKKVLEVVTDIADIIPTANGELPASQFLQHFGFEPPKQHVYVSQLSGGEKRRLYLLTVLMKNPNFLILDEPTNDLDILTLQTLEDFLGTFSGCIIVVTHDRYFMDKVVDHLFIFEGDGEITDFNGSYSRYREQKLQEEKAAITSKTKPAQTGATSKEPSVVPPSKRKLNYKEQKEFDLLEKEIAALENEKKKLTEKMNSGRGSHEELSEWANRIQVILEEMDSKELRWLELSERE